MDKRAATARGRHAQPMHRTAQRGAWATTVRRAVASSRDGGATCSAGELDELVGALRARERVGIERTRSVGPPPRQQGEPRWSGFPRSRVWVGMSLVGQGGGGGA